MKRKTLYSIVQFAMNTSVTRVLNHTDEQEYRKHHHPLYRDSITKLMFSSEESMCTKHNGKLVEYFCRIHEECCCSVCATIGHKQCKVEFIDDIAIAFDKSGEYKSPMSVITDLSQQMQNTKIMALTKMD